MLTVSRGRNALQEFRKRSHAGPYTCSIENCFPQPLCLRCSFMQFSPNFGAPYGPPPDGSKATPWRLEGLPRGSRRGLPKKRRRDKETTVRQILRGRHRRKVRGAPPVPPPPVCLALVSVARTSILRSSSTRHHHDTNSKTQNRCRRWQGGPKVDQDCRRFRMDIFSQRHLRTAASPPVDASRYQYSVAPGWELVGSSKQPVSVKEVPGACDWCPSTHYPEAD